MKKISLPLFLLFLCFPAVVNASIAGHGYDKICIDKNNHPYSTHPDPVAFCNSMTGSYSGGFVTGDWGTYCGNGTYETWLWHCSAAPICELSYSWEATGDSQVTNDGIGFFPAVGGYACKEVSCSQTWADPDLCDPNTNPGAEPPTCSDGEKSADEIGIDCGGSCSAACVDSCFGSDLTTEINGKQVCTNGVPVEPNSLGVCPSGTDTLHLPADGTHSTPYVQCLPYYDPVPAKDPSVVPEPAPPEPAPIFTDETTTTITTDHEVTTDPDGTVTETDTTEKVTTGSDSSTNDTTTVITVTNPDGSKTITTTTTTTTRGTSGDGSGNTSTTSVNTKTYGSDGTLLSDDTTTTTDKAEEDPAPATDPVPFEPEALPDPSEEAGKLNWSPITQPFSTLDQRFPFSLVNTIGGAFDALKVGGSPVPSWTLVIYGHSFIVSLDFMKDFAYFVRNLMHWAIGVLFLYKIYRRWASDRT